MKKLLFSALVAIGLMTTLPSCERIAPTEAGFKISNSGNYRGVDSLPLLSGWQFYMPGFTKIITIPTTQIHKVWSEAEQEGSEAGQHITIACMGGAGFKTDVGINFHVDATKASKIYLAWKLDDLETITDQYIRNVVRGSMQHVSGYMTVDSMLNNLPQFETIAGDTLSHRLARIGFVLDNFSVLSQPRPTDGQLAGSINAKIKAKQDAERTKMEEQTSIAQANKDIAQARGDSASKVIRASGEAEAVRKIQTVLTPTYVEYVRAQSWNGVLPATMLGSGTTTMFSLK